jgi:tetratricopeptide (TPR) repeat protein
MGDVEKAENELREAIKQDPNDGAAHVELGSLLLEVRDGRLREAKRAFQKAGALHRTSVSAAIGLSECQRIEGNLEKAEEELRTALGRVQGSGRWRLHAALARLLIKNGQDRQDRQLFSDAYDAACEAVKLAPRTAEPSYLAGISRRLMGDHAEVSGRRALLHRSAVGHFRECLRIDPNHREARRELIALQGDRAERRSSLPGRFLLGAIGLALLGISVASLLKRVQMSSETFILVFFAGIALLGVAVLFDGLKRIKGPAGLEIEFNPPDPEVAIGPVGKLVVGVDRIDLPPYLASGRPQRDVVVASNVREEPKDA